MSKPSQPPANDLVESANQRESAAAVLLKDLDERQESVLQELDDLNHNIEDLIDSWQGQNKQEQQQGLPQDSTSSLSTT